MAAPSPQTGVAALRVVLALGVLALALAARRPAPVPVLVLPDAPVASADASPVAGAPPDGASAATLLPTMTTDDLARGVAALAAGGGPALSAEQRARLLPLAEQGLQARQEVDALSTARRAARERLRGSGLALLTAVDAAGLRPQVRR